MTKLSYIDLFAGCGGLSLGLYNSGFWKGLFAIEKSPMAFETLSFNLIDSKNHFSWPDWLSKKEHEINNVLDVHASNLSKMGGAVDLVVGGPPCQGFSVAGKRQEEDQRNQLINSYIQFVELVQPKILLFENVRGFTIGFKKADDSRGKPYSEIVIEKLAEIGYHAHPKVLNFSRFGVPQRRERCIIVGSKDESVPKKFFEILDAERENFLKEKGLERQPTLSDAISDLRRIHGERDSPDSRGFKAGKYGKAASPLQKVLRGTYPKKHNPDSHRFVNHRPHIREKYRVVIEEGLSSKEIRERYPTRKTTTILLQADKISPTITTLPDDYIHYCEPRVLTVREYARIQSFNDWYEFKSKYTTGGSHRTKEVPRYSQIGNAIPPLFGELAGVVLNKLIKTCLNKSLILESVQR